MSNGEVEADATAATKKGGRPKNRPEMTIQVPHEDFAFLKAIESRSTFTAEEVARAFLHVGIWESQGRVPDEFRAAVDEERDRNKLDPVKAEAKPWQAPKVSR